MEIFLLNQPLNAVSKIKIEKNAMNKVGVNVMTEKTISIFLNSNWLIINIGLLIINY